MFLSVNQLHFSSIFRFCSITIKKNERSITIHFAFDGQNRNKVYYCSKVSNIHLLVFKKVYFSRKIMDELNCDDFNL